MQEGSSWRPRDWIGYDNDAMYKLANSTMLSLPLVLEVGAQLMLQAIIKRMKDKGIAPDLFFEEDNNANH